jgi:hypothetical protein
MMKLVDDDGGHIFCPSKLTSLLLATGEEEREGWEGKIRLDTKSWES